LKIFTSICLANAVALYFYSSPQYADYVEFSMFLPFGHLGLFVIIYFIYTVYYYATLKKNEDSQYVKNKYSDIWSRLHPAGDISYNTFEWRKFLKGKYDDGSDDRLNRIKFKQRIYSRIIIWAFLLVPVIWLINMAGMLLSDFVNK
jgi:uncharacterized membrane protein YbhN (UPF0104 family)